MSKLNQKKTSETSKKENKSAGGKASKDIMNSSLMQQKSNDQQSIFSNAPIQRESNKTGLPDNLKSGMENLSGFNLDSVKVHYNSPKPATVQAHAYAQGSDIHLASGQEKHLPHELGHVVQQMQGKVQPTTNIGGVAVNDSPSLESQATAMGNQAMQMKAKSGSKRSITQNKQKGTIQKTSIDGAEFKHYIARFRSNSKDDKAITAINEENRIINSLGDVTTLDDTKKEESKKYT